MSYLSKYNPVYLLLSVILATVLTGCSDREDVAPSASRGYSVMAEIVDFESPSTRVDRTTSEDLWRYSSFDVGDVAGFYSSIGNNDPSEKYPGEGFNNVPMTYTKQFLSFTNFEIDYVFDNFFQGSSFFYFPWHANIDYDPGHSIFQGDDYGMELREECEDGVTRCKDFLWVQHPSSPIASQRYTHAFASIIFLRGEGFENPPDDKKDIKVVLEKGVSHLTLKDSPSEPTYLKNIQLDYLEGYPLKEDECKEWYAWQGEQYHVNDQDSKYYDKIFYEPYYIVLPTTRGSERLNVDHIEIYDNDGNLRTITNFSLYTSNQNQKILYPGQRYPLVIKIEELEPSVVPISIVPWGESELIQENRAAGISTIENFQEWVLNYNSFISGGLTKPVEDVLLKYGDKTETSTGTLWKFYLNANLDFSKEEVTFPPLQKFKDTFDGNGYTLEGLKFNIIDELEENGRLENISFQGINISSDVAGQDIGGVMRSCKGSISNCRFDGLVSSEGGVGLIAAEATDANITGCTLRGLISGTSTNSYGMFAHSNGITPSGNNTSGLIFQQK